MPKRAPPDAVLVAHLPPGEVPEPGRVPDLAADPDAIAVFPKEA